MATNVIGNLVFIREDNNLRDDMSYLSCHCEKKINEINTKLETKLTNILSVKLYSRFVNYYDGLCPLTKKGVPSQKYKSRYIFIFELFYSGILSVTILYKEEVLVVVYESWVLLPNVKIFSIYP